jgi:hypothetical protein
VVLRLVLWSTADSLATIDDLRDAVRGEPTVSPGLLFGSWVSDEAGERFGVVQLWETREGAEAPLPRELVELIGGEPPIAELFDVEATSSVAPELQGLGIAFS